jgi:hypothetical protein
MRLGWMAERNQEEAIRPGDIRAAIHPSLIEGPRSFAIDSTL